MQSISFRVLTAAFVIAHFVGNLWHGEAHSILEIALPVYKTAFVLIAIILGPIVGSILTWTSYRLIGYWMVGVSMTSSVVFSVYHHFVMISNDNVEHLPPGTAEAHAHFSNSAEAIALIALAGALIAFYAAGKQYAVDQANE